MRPYQTFHEIKKFMNKAQRDGVRCDILDEDLFVLGIFAKACEIIISKNVNTQLIESTIRHNGLAQYNETVDQSNRLSEEEYEVVSEAVLSL